MTLVGIEGTHPWLNENMTVVGYGPSSSDSEFQKSRLLLSQIVNAVVQHFQLNPPTNLRIIDKSLQRMQTSRSSTVGSSSGSSGGRLHRQSNTQGQTSGQSAPPYSPPPRKKDVSEIHFSDVVTLDASDKQKILSSMGNNYVSKSDWWGFIYSFFFFFSFYVKINTCLENGAHLFFYSFTYHSLKKANAFHAYINC